MVIDWPEVPEQSDDTMATSSDQGGGAKLAVDTVVAVVV